MSSQFSPIFSFFPIFPISHVQISYFPIFLSLCAAWHPEYNSGEQNKDITKARQKRGMMDTLVILLTSADRSRFAPDRNLRNIMTGAKADNAVNVDRIWATTGEKILSSMTGKTAGNYTFKGSEQAVTLASKSPVRIESDNVQTHPQLLL